MVAIVSMAFEEKAVIQKAFQRSGEALDLNNDELGRIIGKDRQTVTREKPPEAFKPSSKSGEAALNFIRVYRSLSALMGGDKQNMVHWLDTQNSHLGSKPKDLLFRTQDLINVVAYLDAMRGKM